jgi:uncharacterized protein
MKMFTASEEKNLDYVLSQVADRDSSLYLEELHGFLFGLAVTPEAIMPSEWIGIIFGEEGPLFDNEQDAQTCLGHLMAAYNRIMNDSNRGRLRFPFDYKKMSDPDFELIEGWAYGLFLALSLRPHFWGMNEENEEMDEDDLPEDVVDVINSCCIITAIAIPEERDGIFETLPGHQPKSDEEIEDILYGMLPVCVETVQEYGQELRRKMFPGTPQPEKHKTEPSNKIGRNEPCPCGSGKKYKKCCGSN